MSFWRESFEAFWASLSLLGLSIWFGLSVSHFAFTGAGPWWKFVAAIVLLTLGILLMIRSAVLHYRSSKGPSHDRHRRRQRL